MYCVHCGAENPGNATFCQKCGKQLPTTDQDEPTVSSIPSSLSTPYGNTPYSNTPSASAETVYAPTPTTIIIRSHHRRESKPTWDYHLLKNQRDAGALFSLWSS